LENQPDAWVPPVFVPLVQAGINVIPERCVLWLEDCPASLQQLWNKVAQRAPAPRKTYARAFRHSSPELCYL
jgi:hypothetical protein